MNKPDRFFQNCIFIPSTGFLLLCLLWNTAQAQPRRLIANHWYFGNHYGLDFSNGLPTTDYNSSIFSYEAACTMSDLEGNLLFYSNSGGRIDGSITSGIWNRNHEMMEGGDMGLFMGGGHSAAQGALSIKKPGSDSLYYLFTVDEFETLNVPGNPFPEGKGLSVFEIDMSENNGLGKVIDANKKLLSPCFEYLAGTLHGNCEDYWILTRNGHRFLDGQENVPDSFYLFQVTENGISAPAVTPVPPGGQDISLGLIRFSPDGKKFLSNGMLYQFDKHSGEIGAGINLQNALGIDPYYPLAFSSDGRFLYYFKIYDSNPDPFEPSEILFKAFQFDLFAPNWFLSVFEFEEIKLPAFGLVATPQLAPDGKLYIPTHYGVAHGPTKVFVINQPNVKGAGAGLEGPVITLSHDENQIFLRFGNFTDDIFYIDPDAVLEIDIGDDIDIPCDETITLTLEGPPGMDHYLWSDGSTADSLEVGEAGTYWLEVLTGCDFGSDTISLALTNEVFSVELGNDTLLCEEEELYLTTIINPLATYSWQDGSTEPWLDVAEAGTYFVDVNIGACFDSDTISVEYLPLPVVDLGNDTTICNDDEMTLSIGGGLDSLWQIAWQDGSEAPEFVISEAGVYTALVANECGVASDRVSIDFKDCDECAIYIPNSFSPNYDGINDAFAVYTLCEFDRFNLKIFDRWGGLLFESQSPKTTWNGMVRSKANNPGVYVYLLEYRFISGRGELIDGMRSGSVTLLR